MKKVGIIGCGAIGSLIVKAVEKQTVTCDELILYDSEIEKAEALKKSTKFSITITKDVESMLKLKPSVIVEAASQQAAKEYIPTIQASSTDLIVMSVGALLDSKLKNVGRIYWPSGAIGGLDAISSAFLAGIDEIILTSRKPPKALDLNVKMEKLVYEGKPEEAVRRFPREMNVAATLSLTVGSEKLKVRVIADPRVNRNIHEILVKWKYGEMFLRFSNDPHPSNPKTSALAAWSAIELLKDVLEKQSSS